MTASCDQSSSLKFSWPICLIQEWLIIVVFHPQRSLIRDHRLFQNYHFLRALAPHQPLPKSPYPLYTHQTWRHKGKPCSSTSKYLSLSHTESSCLIQDQGNAVNHFTFCPLFISLTHKDLQIDNMKNLHPWNPTDTHWSSHIEEACLRLQSHQNAGKYWHLLYLSL